MSWNEPTDYQDPEADPADEGAEVTLKRGQIRNMEKDAKRARQADEEKATAEAEALSAKRELAFLKADVDTDSKLGQFFVEKYDGELEPEAIKGAWAAIQGLKPEGSDPEDVEAAKAREALSEGAVGDTGVAPPEPVKGKTGKAVRAGQSVLENGKSREEAMGTVISTLVEAAASGDQSVLIETE